MNNKIIDIRIHIKVIQRLNTISRTSSSRHTSIQKSPLNFLVYFFFNNFIHNISLFPSWLAITQMSSAVNTDYSNSSFHHLKKNKNKINSPPFTIFPVKSNFIYSVFHAESQENFLPHSHFLIKEINIIKNVLVFIFLKSQSYYN